MIDSKQGVAFEIHIDRGDVTGKCWNGTFRAKAVLSFADQIRMDRIKRDLLGPGPYDGVDQEVLAQAIILARIQVSLTEFPEWWQGGMSHSDNNLLKAIWDECIRIREEHYAEIEKAGSDAHSKLREISEKK